MVVNAELIKHFDSMFALILRHHTQGPHEFLDLIGSFLVRNTDFFKVTENGSWHSVILEIFKKYANVYNEITKRKLQDQEVEALVQPAKQYKLELPKPKPPKPHPHIKINVIRKHKPEILSQPTSETITEEQETSAGTKIVYKVLTQPQLLQVQRATTTDATTSVPSPTIRGQGIYERFMAWKKDRELNEDTLIEYFGHLAQTYKQAELWSLNKSLKRMFEEKGHIIDSATFAKLAELIKNPHLCSVNKWGVFTHVQVHKFLQNAPNKRYLLDKVILVIGVTGGCGISEMIRLKMSDVREVPGGYEVTTCRYDFKMGREVVIHKFIVSGYFCSYIRQYINLRKPHDVKGDPFVIYYKDGICVNTLVGIGITTFGKCGYRIAKCLGIANPLYFKSNCFIDTYKANKEYFIDKALCKTLSEDGDNTQRCVDNVLLNTHIKIKQEQEENNLIANVDVKNEVCVEQRVCICSDDDIECLKVEVAEEITCEEEVVICG